MIAIGKSPQFLTVLGLVGVLAVGILIVAFRGPSATQIAKESIQRVAIADSTLAKERWGVTKSRSSTHSERADAIDRYCAEAVGIDLSGCPPEFIEAYHQEIEAYRGFANAYRELPDSKMLTFVEGFVSGLTLHWQSEIDRLNALKKDMNGALGEVDSALDRVREMAAKYGVVWPSD
jgi:hypothetical protein